MPVQARGAIPKRVIEAWLSSVFESEMDKGKRRKEIYFNPDTLDAWPAELPPKGRRKTNRIGQVLHFVENPAARTPTGGKYIARRFTIRIDGERWVGTMKKDSYIVKLRPESEALENA
jgi:hypothetical protein